MAGARRAARSRGKSDAIDALAVARAAIREPGLPAAHLEGASRELRLLVDHREDLVCERTRIQNRLRWHLHEIDPELEPSRRSLGTLKVLDRLGRRLARRQQSVQVRVARELVGHCRELSRQADRLEREIETLVRREARRRGRRDRALPHDAQLAMHAGVAPLDVSSGRQQRHRLNRAGNRQLNRALHTIAIVQKRTYAPAKAYIARHQADGKSNKEALRALKRQLARRVFNILSLIAGCANNPQRIQISTPPQLRCLT